MILTASSVLARAGCALALAVALMFVLALPPAAHARGAVITVDPGRLGARVSPGFLGLSFEATALPTVAGYARRGNLVHLLRSLGHGVLRFGGTSLDVNTAYVPWSSSPPAWATTVLRPGDFKRLGELLERSGWRAIVGVPLGHFDPAAAVTEVAAAKRWLGPRLLAIEVGNEPDAFGLHGFRPRSWNYAAFRSEASAYQQAIHAALPDVRIAGPATAGRLWLAPYASDLRPALLTAHYYPLSACRAPAPTLKALLGGTVAQRERQALEQIAAIARAHHVRPRMAETNNVGCKGRKGVSNTEGAALWALRYMAGIAAAGISGVNFHTLIDDCNGYSPICAAAARDRVRGTLSAMPEWYALLMFARLTGDRVAHVEVAGSHLGLTAAAFARGSRVRILLVNSRPHRRSAASVLVRVRGRFASGRVLRLTARALDASTGLTLGGGHVRDGSWRPARRLPRARRTARGFLVRVPARSAALVTLHRRR